MNNDLETDQATLATLFGIHITYFFVLIPKIDSEVGDYFVTETTYVDGWEVDKHEYIESQYVSGTLIKIILILIGGITSPKSEITSFLRFSIIRGKLFSIKFFKKGGKK